MRCSLLILTVLLFMTAIGFSQTTWYVPDDFSTIQGAISDASVVNGDTVIVRTGTYVENIDFLGKAITLTSEEGQDITFIDGSQTGRVVTCQSGEGPDSVLDGFTITNGYSGGGYGGGGMYNIYSSSPTVTNCTFAGNSATNSGGGMYNIYSSSPTVTNCTFFGNSASLGGGISNWSSSSPTVTNCILWNDSPHEILVYNSSSPTVTYSCVQGGWPGTGNIDADPLFADPGIDDFHLTWLSPCIDAGNNNAPKLPPTDFEGDPRILDGDFDTIAVVDIGCDEHNPSNIYVPDDFSTIQAAINASINGCTIIVRVGTYVENIDFLGKAIAVKSKKGPDVTSIDGNQAGSVVTCQSGEGSDSVLDGFTITNGSGSSGGGMWNAYSSPTVTSCIFTGNSTLDYGGGMYNYSNSPTVTECTFIGNSSDYGGGMFNSHSSPAVTNCTYTGNWANVSAGGMFNYSYSSPTVTNCIFTGNSSTNYGGGMYNYDSSSPTVTNCTFAGNSAIYGGGISNYSSSSPTVTNCILWNDSPDEIYIYSSSPTVTYSCVQGGWPGTGNIDQNPLFLDPFNDDYHLTYASLCIDAGDNYAPSLPATDFEGDPRVFQGNGTGLHSVGSPPHPAIVDMGADEYCLLKRQGLK